MNWDSKERRRFVRIKYPCEITVLGPRKRIISTYPENISAGGIRLIIKEAIEPSSTLSLDLYGIAREPIVCRGRVKWVFTKKDPYDKKRTLYDVGIEFLRMKKEDVEEIKKLIVIITSEDK